MRVPQDADRLRYVMSECALIYITSDLIIKVILKNREDHGDGYNFPEIPGFA